MTGTCCDGTMLDEVLEAMCCYDACGWLNERMQLEKLRETGGGAKCRYCGRFDSFLRGSRGYLGNQKKVWRVCDGRMTGQGC